MKREMVRLAPEMKVCIKFSQDLEIVKAVDTASNQISEAQGKLKDLLLNLEIRQKERDDSHIVIYSLTQMSIS